VQLPSPSITSRVPAHQDAATPRNLSDQARIVNVSSLGQHPMLTRGYSGSRAYTRSKLAQIMFTFDLARELDPATVTVNCLHPATYMATTTIVFRPSRPAIPCDGPCSCSTGSCGTPVLPPIHGGGSRSVRRAVLVQVTGEGDAARTLLRYGPAGEAEWHDWGGRHARCAKGRPRACQARAS
jgi:NAD(P)-dependent dehydrogenase (short-subunit alcohol dehydrogenase family)